jgi:hypothetical protein
MGTGPGSLGTRPVAIRVPDDLLEMETTNQTIFREMNEWIVDGLTTPDSDGTRAFLCECSDPGCTRPIALTHSEYEAVRAEPTRFVIAVDHENPELDHVVAENARFATVEKFYGPTMRIARSTDPRR